MRPTPSTIVSFFDMLQIKVLDIHHEEWSYRSNPLIKRRQYLSVSVAHDDRLCLNWEPLIANFHFNGHLTRTVELSCKNPQAQVTFAVIEQKSIMGRHSQPKVVSIHTLSAGNLSSLNGKIKLFSPGTSTTGVPAATLDVKLSVARRPEFKSGPGSNEASALVQRVEPGRMLCAFGEKEVWIPTTSLDKQYWVQHDTPEATYRVIPAGVDLGHVGCRSFLELNL